MFNDGIEYIYYWWSCIDVVICIIIINNVIFEIGCVGYDDRKFE